MGVAGTHGAPPSLPGDLPTLATRKEARPQLPEDRHGAEHTPLHGLQLHGRVLQRDPQRADDVAGVHRAAKRGSTVRPELWAPVALRPPRTPVHPSTQSGPLRFSPQVHVVGAETWLTDQFGLESDSLDFQGK